MVPTGGHANSYQPKTTLLPVLIRTKKWSQQGGMQILINQQVHSCTLYSIWDTKMNPTRGHANLYRTKQIWQGSNHQNIQDYTNREKTTTNTYLRPDKDARDVGETDQQQISDIN